MNTNRSLQLKTVVMLSCIRASSDLFCDKLAFIKRVTPVFQCLFPHDFCVKFEFVLLLAKCHLTSEEAVIVTSLQLT